MAAFKTSLIIEYEDRDELRHREAQRELNHLQLKSTHPFIDLSPFNFSVQSTAILRGAISRLCPTVIAQLDVSDIVDLAIAEVRKLSPDYQPKYRKATHEETCAKNQAKFGRMPRREDWQKHLRRVQAERPDLFGRIMDAEQDSARKAENKRIIEIQTRIATGSGRPPANAGRSYFETSQE